MEDSDPEAGEKDPLVDQHHTAISSNSLKPLESHSLHQKTHHKKKSKEVSKTGLKEGRKHDHPEKEEEEDTGPSLMCPFFGVRNYLHHFYERPDVKNMSLYEEAPLPVHQYEGSRETIFLVKRRELGICSSSSVFRLSLMLGGIILLMGTTALIVAVCASRKATLVGQVGGVTVVDRVAAAHNAEVDALILVALIALTLGATVIAAALISRTFCSKPDYEDAIREGIISERGRNYEHPLFFEATPSMIPSLTQEITQIQPSNNPSRTNFRN